MSRTERIRPTGAAVLIGAMIGAVSLTGCGAGQLAQTAEQVSAVNGANAGTRSVVVRDAQIEFPEEAKGGNVYTQGGSAPLQLSIVNTGANADKLVSASSPVASSVQISGDSELPGGQVIVVDGEPAAPAPVVTGTAKPATPAAATTTKASASGAREAQIVLVGLRENVRAGLTYPLVLVFERAGEIRLDIPVGNPSTPREE